MIGSIVNALRVVGKINDLRRRKEEARGFVEAVDRLWKRAALATADGKITPEEASKIGYDLVKAYEEGKVAADAIQSLWDRISAAWK